MTKAQLLRINFPIENLRCEIAVEFNLFMQLWLTAELARKNHLHHLDLAEFRNEQLIKIEKLDDINNKLSLLQENSLQKKITSFEDVLDNTLRECTLLSKQIAINLANR